MRHNFFSVSSCLSDDQLPHVVLGFDTRESSPALANEVDQGVSVMHGICHELGLVTTPQLHYFVQYIVSYWDWPTHF